MSRIIIVLSLIVTSFQIRADAKIDFCENESSTCNYINLDEMKYDLSNTHPKDLHEEVVTLKQLRVRFLEQLDNVNTKFKYKNIEIENDEDGLEKINRLIAAYQRFYIELFGHRFSGEAHAPIYGPSNLERFTGCLKKSSPEAKKAINIAKSKALSNCSSPGSYLERFESRKKCLTQMGTIYMKISDLTTMKACTATFVLHRNH